MFRVKLHPVVALGFWGGGRGRRQEAGEREATCSLDCDNRRKSGIRRHTMTDSPAKEDSPAFGKPLEKRLERLLQARATRHQRTKQVRAARVSWLPFKGWSDTDPPCRCH